MGIGNVIDKAKKKIVSFATSDTTDKAQEYLDQAAQIKNKSVSELQGEGRAAAGQAATDKAGIAKKNAKAATMQAGGNKLQAATNAAGAAQEAATEGYDTASAAYTNMAQQQDITQKDAERNALLEKSRNENERSNRNANFTNSLLSFGAAAMSDKRTKRKYTYIPKEERD